MAERSFLRGIRRAAALFLVEIAVVVSAVLLAAALGGAFLLVIG